MAHIVITSWGSYGDLYPYIGLGRALADRRHRVTLAVPAYYAPMVEGAGLAHAPVGPDIDPDDRAIVARVMDPVRGPEVLIREWLMPRLEQTYRQLLDAATGADLLVSHPVTFAAPAVAQVLGLPWIATVLAPMSFFSVEDPPVLAHAPHLAALRRVGSFYGRLVRWVAERATRTWVEPASRLRREHQVPGDANPLIDGQFSPYLNLALFSEVLGAPQTDWPTRTRQTGFVFYNGASAMPPELDAFLDAGPPPVVFTLGSSAVNAAGRFYAESAAAARALGVRAVLMTGGVADNERIEPSRDVLLVPGAPHQLVFPRASVVVHHGGVGTTGQGLRSGRPTLVVPHAHDQADNADRVARLGTSRTIRAGAYRAPTVARELARILNDPAYATQAATVGRCVSSEDGAARGADAVEEVLKQTLSPSSYLLPPDSCPCLPSPVYSQPMLERLSTLLGVDPRELSGTTVDADLPLTPALINRKIAEYLAQSDGKVSAVVVEPLAGDALNVHVRLKASLVPPLPVRLEIAGQPEWPASPVLVLRWSLSGGLGVLARAASPILSMFGTLPPGVRVDGDLIGIDIGEVLRSRGAAWLVPLVKRLRVHTSDAGVSVKIGLGL